MASCDLNAALAGKRKLIARVADTFVRRNGFIEFDDAFQVVSMAAWAILENPPPGAVNVDGLIVMRGVQRLIDELRSGRITGIRRSGIAAGHRVPISLNAPVSVGDETLRLVELLHAEETGYRKIEDTDEMDAAVGCLPERERFVIYLVFYEELSQREVSELLGVSEGRISQIVARAQQRMRAQLAA
jgi:RNA polymerase sigma factor (sigma-70 family)